MCTTSAVITTCTTAAGNNAVYAVEVEKVEVCTVIELPEAETILSCISGLHQFDDISVTDCVDVCGTEYRRNMVLVVDAEDEPVFCRIVRCLVVTDVKFSDLCLIMR